MAIKLIAAATIICSLALPLLADDAQSRAPLPERFTAFAVSSGGPRSNPVATQVEITIDRWSTADEAQRLTRTLKEKGPEALLETLRDLKPVGTIKTPGNLAYDLHYADHESASDGGRRIFLATDRPVTYWEAVNRRRIVNYPFTFIELRMNGKGEGEGKLALATQINLSGGGRTIELVNYHAQPIDLNEVRRVAQ